MASAEMTIRWDMRSAIFTPDEDNASLGLVKGQPVPCRVWGCYQITSGSEATPCFIVELDSGRCAKALPEQLEFVKGADEC